MSLTFGSVCSGIEAASVAWHPLGWRTAFLSEIAPFPRAVLSHHYPDTPLRGDFTEIEAGDHDPIDVLVGGTPCQSFSVAGLRGGMADARGNLALEYLRLADRLRPRWLVWENVPGVLSSNGGRDFGSFLGGLGQLGYGFAYRVLDAQHFGLAQRRARVFVVGYLGDWRRAATVLFEPASLRRHPAPSREAGKATAYDLAPSLTASGRGVERTGESRGQDPVVLAYGGNNQSGPIDVATALNASHTASGRQDCESETFIATTLRARDQSRGVDSDCTDTLIAFDTTQMTSVANRSNPKAGDPCHPLARGAHPPAVAFDWYASHQQGMPVLDVSPPLKTTMQPAIASAAIRRLTPRECERLQGFPDDYTLVPYRKKLAADGPRYQALGNSMATNVMAWIGKRIVAQEADLRATIPMLDAAE